ncbi:hypothetical protein PCANC_20824 [Puccinia coronata f. sp. avenae]|uniref:Ribosomal eL28/Mak16 domain-containing protein n=1 Tax=Puccinia coronata f. sp. avenae TaxID=200324 RepID=A0A2N5U9R0_9BASI|nr:hypothetical protein PCANC_20824 [Puccinia coronata f. sp. avenae]PLW34483.1 hypothetical protein PCASD_09813 [Puccinia coronata f. sp. avenae]
MRGNRCGSWKNARVTAPRVARPSARAVPGDLLKAARRRRHHDPLPNRIQDSSRLHQMDNAGSADLQWFLVRGWNSRVVKRGGFMFSSEPGNLKNKHSPRYSGLIHPKPMSVTPAPSGGVLITTRKDSANPRQLKAARNTVRVKGSMAGSRRAAGKAAKAAKNYRSDLARAAILRAARIAQSNVRSNKPKSA